jgi:hypothetical protein
LPPVEPPLPPPGPLPVETTGAQPTTSESNAQERSLRVMRAPFSKAETSATRA